VCDENLTKNFWFHWLVHEASTEGSVEADLSICIGWLFLATHSQVCLTSAPHAKLFQMLWVAEKSCDNRDSSLGSVLAMWTLMLPEKGSPLLHFRAMVRPTRNANLEQIHIRLVARPPEQDDLLNEGGCADNGGRLHFTPCQ
jgi:hypothetical protein